MESEKMPEALQLADALEADYYDDVRVTAAAVELRRLHALVMDQQGEIYGLNFARETERKIHGLVKAERDALRADYGNACKLVVDMHAAATGRPGEGPRLGVVEDVAAVRAECDALRADAERLDWLDKFALSVDMVADPDNRVQVWHSTARPPYMTTGRTLREAIDAAREAK